MILKMLLIVACALATTARVSEAAETCLWRLDCGTIQVNDLGLFSDTFAYQGRSKTFADSCYLIRHGQEYMLWDAGLPAKLLGAPRGDGPMSPRLDKTLLKQLREIGIAPGQISRLGVSHAHFDHVGQAAAFPQARLFVGKADFDALAADPPPFGVDPDLLAPWRKGDAPVEPVAGDRDIFGDGSVVMLAMPGHTPGSYALLVRLSKTGPVLLGGDVACFEEQLEAEEVPPFSADRAQSLASMARLKGIARRLGARIVIPHDAEDIAKLPAFPASAE